MLFHCFLLISFSLVAAFFEDKNVIQLTSKNFNQVVKKTAKTVFIKYYAPWCGHCKALKPDYERAAKAVRDHIVFAAVNCDIEKSLCSDAKIKGFPTLKLHYQESPKNRKITTYNQERSYNALLSFAKSLTKNLIPSLDSKSLDKFIDNTKVVRVLIRKPKKAASSAKMHGLTFEMYPHVSFAEIIDPKVENTQYHVYPLNKKDPLLFQKTSKNFIKEFSEFLKPHHLEAKKSKERAEL